MNECVCVVCACGVRTHTHRTVIYLEMSMQKDTLKELPALKWLMTESVIICFQHVEFRRELLILCKNPYTSPSLAAKRFERVSFLKAAH